MYVAHMFQDGNCCCLGRHRKRVVARGIVPDTVHVLDNTLLGQTRVGPAHSAFVRTGSGTLKSEADGRAFRQHFGCFSVFDAPVGFKLVAAMVVIRLNKASEIPVGRRNCLSVLVKELPVKLV